MSNLKDVRTVVKGEVILSDGKVRHLVFDLNAFAELEETYGSIEGAMNQMEKGSIKALRTLLWAGLIHEDETLTQRKVGSLINLTNLPDITKMVSASLGQAMPETEESNDDSKGEELKN
jgi:hypothetical protein